MSVIWPLRIHVDRSERASRQEAVGLTTIYRRGPQKCLASIINYVIYGSTSSWLQVPFGFVEQEIFNAMMEKQGKNKKLKAGFNSIVWDDVPTNISLLSTPWNTVQLGCSFILYINYSEITQLHDFKYMPTIRRLLMCIILWILHPAFGIIVTSAIFLYHLTNHTVRITT